jgi:hypothetical protein
MRTRRQSITKTIRRKAPREPLEVQELARVGARRRYQFSDLLLRSQPVIETAAGRKPTLLREKIGCNSDHAMPLGLFGRIE